MFAMLFFLRLALAGKFSDLDLRFLNSRGAVLRSEDEARAAYGDEKNYNQKERGHLDPLSRISAGLL
jgi:hypothetical protein